MPAGCSAIASGEAVQALQQARVYDRLASQPMVTADGRVAVDQHGRAMTAADHIEAASGQRLGEGVFYGDQHYGKDGKPYRRELTAPQRSTMFSGGDDDETGSPVPHATAALAERIAARHLPGEGRQAAREQRHAWAAEHDRRVAERRLDMPDVSGLRDALRLGDEPGGPLAGSSPVSIVRSPAR